MATWTAQRAGNWSRTSDNADSPWYDGSTQSGWASVPGNGDAIVLNGFAVAQDIATIPASGTLLSITDAAKDGKLTLAMDTLSTAVINCTTITCGTSTDGIIYPSGTSVGKSLTINGNIAGGAGTNAVGMKHNFYGTLTVNGNVTGGTSGNYCTGVSLNTGRSSIAVNGNVTGGSLHTGGCGIASYTSTNAGASIVVVGNVTGGSGGTNTAGIGRSNSVQLQITGDISGGAGARSAGVSNDYNDASDWHRGNRIDTLTAMAVSGRPLRWDIDLATGRDYYLRTYLPSGDTIDVVAARASGGGRVINGGLVA
jgi:hypothetical protein